MGQGKQQPNLLGWGRGTKDMGSRVAICRDMNSTDGEAKQKFQKDQGQWGNTPERQPIYQTPLACSVLIDSDINTITQVV